MSIYRKLSFLLAVLLLSAGASDAPAQRAKLPWGPMPDPESAVQVSIDDRVPLTIASKDTSETEFHLRGGLMVVDLRLRLSVENTAPRHVRAVTFGVVAGPVTAGGKASVSLPSLNVAPGDTFPVNLNLKLIRPMPAPRGEFVKVSVDGVLLSDFTFFGPDQLDSRRKMTFWEKEADRDRRYFKTALDVGGPAQLQAEVRASLERQQNRPRLAARLAAGGTWASETEQVKDGRSLKLALLDLPEAPLELLSGTATVDGASATTPVITVKNRSQRPIRYFELGWFVDDGAGVRYVAGWVPAPSPARPLHPGRSTSTSLARRIVFASKSGNTPRDQFSINGMGGYVSQVQFGDGTFWIPSRDDIQHPSLRATPVSAEEQRLSDLYRRKGLEALIKELSKF